MKVLLYGIGSCYKVYRNTLNVLNQEGIIDIVGIADKILSGKDEYQGHKIYSIEEIVSKQDEIDSIFICATGLAAKSIQEDLYNNGIHIKTECLDDYQLTKSKFRELNKNQIDKQLSVIQTILDSSDEEISDVNWMCQRIKEFGIYPFSSGGEDEIYQYCGLQQIPMEFARLCTLLAKAEINTAMEIGVYRGRSSYFMCAVLSRKNPNLKYHMVDIANMLDEFEAFHQILPQLIIDIPSSSNDFEGQSFDFVFIDADHSYDGSIRDYEKVGKYTGKILAFHDVFAHEYDHENGGTVRMWNEVKSHYKESQIKEFSECDRKWMGIGVVTFE